MCHRGSSGPNRCSQTGVQEDALSCLMDGLAGFGKNIHLPTKTVGITMEGREGVKNKNKSKLAFKRDRYLNWEFCHSDYGVPLVPVIIIFVPVPVIIESGCAEEAVCVLGFKGIV